MSEPNRLSVCHRCASIGSEAEGKAHRIARGHDVEILTPEVSQEIRDLWADEQAERVIGLIQLGRLNRRSVASRPADVQPGDQK